MQKPMLQSEITSCDNLDREKMMKIWVIYENKKYV